MMIFPFAPSMLLLLLYRTVAFPWPFYVIRFVVTDEDGDANGILNAVLNVKIV